MNVLLLNPNGIHREWTRDVIDHIKTELSIDKLYVVPGECADIQEYQSCDEIISQKDCRTGEYEEYYAKFIKKYWPLDEKVLNEFEQYIPEIMLMMSRDEADDYRVQVDSSFDGRYRLVMNNLRFWYSFLCEKEIDYVIFSFSPHVGYDYLIYNLCKVISKRTIIIFDDFLHDRRRFVARDLECFESTYRNAEREVEELLAAGEKINLSEELEEELAIMSSLDQNKMMEHISTIADVAFKPVFRFHYGYRSLPDYISGVLKEMYDRYLSDYTPVISVIKTVKNGVPSLFREYGKQHFKFANKVYQNTLELFRVYDEISMRPDYSKKYIYCPFHYLPEDSSNPRGGRMYADQSIGIGVVAAAIPDDWKIYVKIHPAQLGIVGVKEAMIELLRIPKVKLIKRETSTLELTKNAKAIMTLTGHNAWEAQFLNVPALVFGLSDLRYAPLSYYVRTIEDCKNAIDDIINNPKTTDLEELRRFLLIHEHYTYYFDKEKIVEGVKRVIQEYEEQH